MTQRYGRAQARTAGALMALAGLVLPVTGLWRPAVTAAQTVLRTDLPEATVQLPLVSVDDAVIAEGDSGSLALVFTLRLSGAAADPVTVDVSTADSTATAADLDYEPSSALVTFAPGSVAESVTVAVRGDMLPEADEVFVLRLASPLGAALADSEAVGRIVNDDLPWLSVDDASMLEGHAGSQSLWFTVRLSAQHVSPVSVDVFTLDSTATLADADYAAVSLQLTFPPGSTELTVPVPVLGDTTHEADEWLRVRLTNPAGGVLADSEAVGTLLNDDLPVISVADTTMDEGDLGSRALSFRVRLTSPATLPVPFQYQLVDGTATAADRDYVPASGDTLFGPGQDQVVIDVQVLGDPLLEANERFTLRIHGVQHAEPATVLAIGTIRNDERTSFTSLNVAVPKLSPGTLPPSWGDSDGDGRPDLLLYSNTGATFTEMPGVRSLLGDGNYHGGAWCDYDRDGDQDAVLMPYADNISGYNFTHLFENTPNGLEERAPALGMDIVGLGETPAWGDFDADGWPDLFLPFYSHVAPSRSYFFRNLGNGQFHERAESAGVALPNIPAHLRPEGTGVADWNGDGTLDIYCASHLLLNDGDGNFTDVRAQVGLPVVFDEGAQFVDHDDDGDLDLYLRTAWGPTLYRNDAGAFVNVTPSLGLSPVGWAWGDRWADLDGDGDLDLLYFPPGGVARLLLSRGDGTFVEDASFAGLFSGLTLSAFADMDADGDMDIAVGDYGRRIARNLLEQVPRAHAAYLKVRVEDADGKLTAHGATVRLRSLDDPRHPVQTRIVDGGSGYLGQDEYTLTFGGVGSGAFDLEVSYPSKPGSPRVVGPAQSPLLHGIRPGQIGPQLVVVRSDGQVWFEPITASADVDPGATGPLPTLWHAAPNPARSVTRFDFSEPAGGRIQLTIHDLSGRRLRTLTGSGRTSGDVSISWDLRDDAGRDVPAGLYFARLQRDSQRAGVQRVVVIR